LHASAIIKTTHKSSSGDRSASANEQQNTVRVR
jgi:hypothetical protein